MTPDPDQTSFLQAMADGFWDHFWTCWVVLEAEVAWLFWLVFQKKRRLWHWLFLVPLGAIGAFLFLLPFVALLAAGTTKFGWNATLWASDLWAGMAAILDREVFPAPKIWQLVLLVLLLIVAYVWKSRRSEVEGPEQLLDGETDSVPPDLEA